MFSYDNQNRLLGSKLIEFKNIVEYEWVIKQQPEMEEETSMGMDIDILRTVEMETARIVERE
jgi:hypothetical protein